MPVKCDVVIASHRSVIGRPFLHLIRSYVDRLHISPLKSAVGAIGVQVMLIFACSEHIAALRPIAWGSRFLVVNAEVRVVSKKIKFVAESLYHRTGKILGARQGQVVERFIGQGKRTIL